MVEINFLPWRQTRAIFYKKLLSVIVATVMVVFFVSAYLSHRNPAMKPQKIPLQNSPSLPRKELSFTYIGYLETTNDKIAWLKNSNGIIIEKKLGEGVDEGKIITITPQYVRIQLQDQKVQKLPMYININQVMYVQ